MRTFEVNPQELGLPLAQPADLRGGLPPENATIIQRILAGEKGPARDIVLLNAAAALFTGQRARSLEEGLILAARSIDEGSARRKLSELVAATSVA